eukprot:jgi/Tetstr1/453300/TSEL_040292.t1
MAATAASPDDRANGGILEEVSTRSPKTSARLSSVKGPPSRWQAARCTLLRFWQLKLAQLLCGVFGLVVSFSPPPLGLLDTSTHTIIDPLHPTYTERGLITTPTGDLRPVVARTALELASLAVSRASAFSIFPVLVFVFFSKCKALGAALDRTPIGMFTFNDCHAVHAYCGQYIAFDVWLHMSFHLVRWGSGGLLSLLWTTTCGATGLVAVACVALIAFPMMYFRNLKYERRKLLHFLFVPMAVALCYHVPTSAFPNGGYLPYVMGSCVCLYVLDSLNVLICMTEKVPTTTFHVLSSGVQITMDVSIDFQRRSATMQGGYANVCLPWVDRTQWHAFSLYEVPTEPSKRQMFMLKTGDWTTAVHTALQRNTVRPAWIQGPFSSPFNSAIMYDNQILVATGIGITPALSVISNQKASRRVNLIWVVRDPAMLEFYLERRELDEDAWNLIYYTGKEPLNPAVTTDMRPNTMILHRRPNLHVAIPNIVYGIESGAGLPEQHTRENEVRLELASLAGRLADGEDMTSAAKLKALNREAQRRGYSLSELVNPTRHVETKEGQRGSREQLPLLELSDRGVKARESLDIAMHSFSQATGTARGARHAQLKVRDSCDEFANAVTKLPGEVMVGGSVWFQTGAKGADGSRCRSGLARLSECDEGGAGAGGIEGEEDCLMPAKRSPTQMIVGVQEGGKVIKQRRASANPTTQELESATQRASLEESITMMAAQQPGFLVHKANACARDYVLSLEPAVLGTWGIMYCGQCEPVTKALRAISEEYNIMLSAETFMW